MIVRGGHTIEVYRPTARNRHGDAINEYVGTIDHVVFQWGSADPVDRAQENDQMTTVIFCPKSASVKLQARDRFKFREETYSVIGDRSWDERHPITGADYGYYMVQVQVMG